MLSCSTLNNNNDDSDAINIASSQIPQGLLLKAKVETYFDSEKSTNGVWQVYFYGFDTTREELEEFGWEEGENVSFDAWDEYHGIIIHVDAETKSILSKEAVFVRLGPRPSVNSSTP
jgi:hypothetical protein